MSVSARAAVVREFQKPLQITQVEIPSPGPGQVLIRVIACGVCHTDLHAAHGDWPVKPTPPFIPGHEGVGEVVEVGPGVTRIKKGDIVGSPWLHEACGCCSYCVTGWETLCETQTNTGYSVNGGFAEYMLAPADYVAEIPEGLDPYDVAPILCAGVTTYKGLKETDAKPGDWVAISGIGGLGHVAVQYAKAMGYKVVAIDHGAEKLALAKELGADLAYDYADKDMVAKVQKDTGGVHGALVTAVSPAAFKQGIDLLRRGGTISLVGLPPGTFETPIFDVVLKRITVRGSIVGTREDLREALQFAADGKIKVHYSKAKLDDINAIFDKMLAGELLGRVVLAI
ncbi:alcohol dehydrogenase AdhP [Silvimonas iriomotensis]|uniref:alcohol dehydrogenase n=1 Tax=Silvimonas iriomotensis TaxID=449662 RepID=A0ABQ2P891_9NEIS|nr:alcohol dehydrogenase AdhP [Silvimonas iriomotensis]GGP20815.1 zinc-dependent alcohol dehydrogenase [Silvimonas iriomotensis]